jgi:hypothetical protein
VYTQISRWYWSAWRWLDSDLHEDGWILIYMKMVGFWYGVNGLRSGAQRWWTCVCGERGDEFWFSSRLWLSLTHRLTDVVCSVYMGLSGEESEKGASWQHGDDSAASRVGFVTAMIMAEKSLWVRADGWNNVAAQDICGGMCFDKKMGNGTAVFQSGGMSMMQLQMLI